MFVVVAMMWDEYNLEPEMGESKGILWGSDRMAASQ